jgi:phosphopantothenoylcysteine decarboxylase/phosphopantothenate--cysteine ligase
MGHIRLSREADLVVVAPATADLLAKTAQGHADDLASTVLLATDKPVLYAPAMNPQMWGHPATRRNVAQLLADGARLGGPGAGDMACGEVGHRFEAGTPAIIEAIAAALRPPAAHDLRGRHAIVTSGPTREAIDPVRAIINHSSGRQGHAIAQALAEAGARVTLVTGPVGLADPVGVETVHVENAREMLAACMAALPADIAVCAAAVADWRPDQAAGQKIKKHGGEPPVIRLVENPDILRTLSTAGPQRPRLVVGFAAETERLVEHAMAKLRTKGCDWIVANDVSPGTGTFGGERNEVTLITGEGPPEAWPAAGKLEIGRRLVARIGRAFADG